MGGDSIDEWRAGLVGEWEPALIGPNLLCSRPAHEPRITLTLRADRTADRPGHPAPGAPPAPVAPFPALWRLSADRVLTIARPLAPMPEYGITDWTRYEEDFRVLSVTSSSLGLARGDVVMVFRRLWHEEHIRYVAAGVGTTAAPQPAAAPDRQGT